MDWHSRLLWLSTYLYAFKHARNDNHVILLQRDVPNFPWFKHNFACFMLQVVGGVTTFELSTSPQLPPCMHHSKLEDYTRKQ